MVKGFYSIPAGSTAIPAGSPNLIHIDRYGIREIDGVGRPEADMYTTELVGADASVYSGQTVKSRTITLSVDAQNEYAARELYRQFPYNTKRRFVFETDYDTYFIDGIAKGMPRTQGTSCRSEFEIPIFCPYPWFRSFRAHSKNFTFNEEFGVTQAGDVRAGIEIYANLTAEAKLTVFKIVDGKGNEIRYNSDIVYTPSRAGKALLIDTTPGLHRFLRLKAVKDIRIINDWVTVPAGEDGTSITASMNAVGASGTAVWYDTWSGI